MDFAQTRLPRFKILLAEDNPVNQRLTLLILNKCGYQADVVSNGLEVLEALERQPYAVILMDVQMPELDGLETTKRIYQQVPLERQPYIIALTAFAMSGDRERCLAVGMHSYIVKPIEQIALLQALQAAEWHYKTTNCDPNDHDLGIAPAIPQLTVTQESELQSNTEPVINWSVIDSIRQMAGSQAEEVISAIVAQFLEDAPHHYQAIVTALQEANPEKLAKTAHTLRSGSISLGAIRLSQQCLDLENQGRQGIIPPAQASMDTLEVSLAEFKSELQRLLDPANRQL